MAEPGVIYVCTGCETQFIGTDCWGCEQPGTPIDKLSPETRVDYAFLNKFEFVQPRTEDDSRGLF